jgi:surface protein
MTIADKLTLLASTKTAIAAAIEDKGVTVGSIPFSQYPEKIAEITGGGPAPEPGAWVRPSDWLALPVIGEDDNMFAGLLAVTNDDSNYIALSAAGNYTVDWGDGTVENYNSDVTAQHVYSFDDPALDGTLSSLGYKQAVVTVTPQSGATFTGINLQLRHSSMSASFYNVPWLDIAMGGAALEDIRFAQSDVTPSTTRLVRLGWCEQAKIVRMSRTTCAHMFRDMSSLKSVPMFNTQSVTIMNSMFSGCSSLQTVPLFNTQSVTSMSSMFSSCTSLQTVPMFNTQSVTNMSSMFVSCTSLQTVPLFNTQSVTNMSSMFNGCSSLQTVPLFNTGAVTNMIFMFSGCTSLQTVPALNTTTVSSSSNFTSIFASCSSLSRIEAKDFRWTFSVANCKLSAAALNEIYTNLPRVTTSQTITVTGNWGVDTATSKTVDTTAQSKTIPMADTSGMAVGQFVTGTGTGITTGVSVASDVSAETLTLNDHGLADGTRVAFSALSSTTGILTWTIYYVVNAATNTFQIALTPGGDPINLTGSNATLTMRYPSYITAIDPGVSITLDTPAATNQTSTSLSFRALDSSTALMKNWAVTF